MRTGEVQDFAAFKWAEPAGEVLDWDLRKARIREEILRAEADVVCLQEVQFERESSSSAAAADDKTPFELPAFLKVRLDLPPALAHAHQRHSHGKSRHLSPSSPRLRWMATRA